jgi:hypothetical protein
VQNWQGSFFIRAVTKSSPQLLDPRTGSRPYDGVMQIGEIARACGVSVDTVRHYERKGEGEMAHLLDSLVEAKED